MNRAKDLARKAGYNDVRVLRVAESDSRGGGYPQRMVMRAMDASEKSTPIAPGELSVGATLSLTFEMVK